MRKNILFNTTRQWNPGDQIIMLGLLRLLRHLDFNIFIYNRHPNVWGKGADNSYKPGHHSLKNIDYYFTAGTPEWNCLKLEPLFEEVLDKKIPHSFIGVGGIGQEKLSTFAPMSKMLETSDLLTARDKGAYGTIAPLGGVLLPCPGFLCGGLPIRPITKIETIGLIFTVDNSLHGGTSLKLKNQLIEGYRAIIKSYPAIIICHYIDEALEARTHFPNTPIYYSCDAKDFESFYALCDLVIGPRLHGVLLAAGLGIPSYIIRGYDEVNELRKLGATDVLNIPFLVPVSSFGFLAAVNNMDVKKESKRLIDLRYKTEIEYLGLFATRITSLYNAAPTRVKVSEEVGNLVRLRREIYEKK